MAHGAADSTGDSDLLSDLYQALPGEGEIDDYMAQLQAVAWSSPPGSPTRLSQEQASGHHEAIDQGITREGDKKPNALTASFTGTQDGRSEEHGLGREGTTLCEYCQTLRLSLEGYDAAREAGVGLYLGRLIMPRAVKDTLCPFCAFVRRYEGGWDVFNQQGEIAVALGALTPAPADQASWESEWRIVSQNLRDYGPKPGQSGLLEIRELCLFPLSFAHVFFTGGGWTTLSWISYVSVPARTEEIDSDNGRIDLEPNAGQYSLVITAAPGTMPSAQCFAGRLVEPPLSHHGLSQMKEWLYACDVNHSCCQNSATHGMPMPTRVVDVGSEDGLNGLRLLVTNGQMGKYLTLSHRWSSRPFTTLLQQNLEQLQESLPVEGLPQTFLDAIRVTKTLGVRYLWIDSLCIIQNDKTDWERESNLMSSVYENAYCTLAATCSTNGSSFLERKETPNKIPVPCSDDDVVYLVSNQPTATPKDEIGAAELNHRGWTMQERILSRRVIHFAESQLYWECRTQARAQAGNLFSTGSIGDFVFPLPIITKVLGIVGETVPTDMVFQHLWVSIASYYSTCHLTHEGDRIPALLGLASMLGRFTTRTFVRGHWFGNGLALSSCLLWTVVGSNLMVPATRVNPSWSWIGLGGEVTFHTTERSAQTSPTLLWGVEQGEDECFDVLIQGKLLDVVAPVANSESRVVPVFNKSEQHYTQGSPIGNVAFDFVNDRPSALTCLYMYTDVVGYAIVLFLADGGGKAMDSDSESLIDTGEDGVYRRVGIGSLNRHKGLHLFTDESESIFRLR